MDEEFVTNCPDDCCGCSCHINPPCSHCVSCVTLKEDEEEEYQPNAGEGSLS